MGTLDGLYNIAVYLEGKEKTPHSLSSLLCSVCDVSSFSLPNVSTYDIWLHHRSQSNMAAIGGLESSKLGAKIAISLQTLTMPIIC